MRKSLIAALVLVASMALTGCGLTPTGTSNPIATRTLDAPAVEFLYLAPFRGSVLKAGSEVIVTARVAYQLPQSGGRLNFLLLDERQRPLPLTQRETVLRDAQGEAVVTFAMKVPSHVQRLTLVAPVTLPGGGKALSATSATFRVSADAPGPEAGADYRSHR